MRVALTQKKIPTLQPGKHAHRHGLYCLVTATGGRSWALRYQRQGRERWHGLGPCHTFTLKEAEAAARKAKQQLFEGVDPIDAKQAQRTAQALEAARTISFADAAKQYYDQHETKWSSAKHAHQFWASLEQYAFPVIGKLPVAAVDTGLILKVIEPIWNERYQTASRLRGRVASVLDWATVRGFRSGDNPARWRGHLSEVLPAKGKFTEVTHHASMPYADVPVFVVHLSQQQGIAPRAMEFLILAASRTAEVIGARWSEFDFEKRIWTIPPDRMKVRKEHRVPLTGRMIKLLKSLPREGGPDAVVFIGSKVNAPLAKNTLSKLVTKTMGIDTTVHGFRSTFRTWAADSTAYPREVIEAALAHTTGSAVELAYQRSDVIEKRRLLMGRGPRSSRRLIANPAPSRRSARAACDATQEAGAESLAAVG
jgi:integrase